jgi:hypothetical protein
MSLDYETYSCATVTERITPVYPGSLGDKHPLVASDEYEPGGTPANRSPGSSASARQPKRFLDCVRNTGSQTSSMMIRSISKHGMAGFAGAFRVSTTYNYRTEAVAEVLVTASRKTTELTAVRQEASAAPSDTSGLCCGGPDGFPRSPSWPLPRPRNHRCNTVPRRP